MMTRWIFLVAALIAFVVLWPLSLPIAGLALAVTGIVRLRVRGKPIRLAIMAIAVGALILVTSLAFGLTFFAARTNVIAPSEGTPITR